MYKMMSVHMVYLILHIEQTHMALDNVSQLSMND